MASGKQHIKFTFIIMDWIRFTYNYGNVKIPEFSYGFKWIPYSRLIYTGTGYFAKLSNNFEK